eukprot:15407_1
MHIPSHFPESPLAVSLTSYQRFLKNLLQTCVVIQINPEIVAPLSLSLLCKPNIPTVLHFDYRLSTQGQDIKSYTEATIIDGVDRAERITAYYSNVRHLKFIISPSLFLYAYTVLDSQSHPALHLRFTISFLMTAIHPLAPYPTRDTTLQYNKRIKVPTFPSLSTYFSLLRS